MKKTWIITAAVLAALMTGCSGASRPPESSAAESAVTESSAGSSAAESASETSGDTEQPHEESSEPFENAAPDPDYDAGTVSVSAAAGDYEIIYTVDEESACAYASVTYSTNYVPDDKLASASLTASAERGECFFANNDSTCSADLTAAIRFNVVDENGHTKTYTVVTERTEGQLPVVDITLADGRSAADIPRNETIGMTISIDCSKSPEYPSGLAEVSGKIRGRGNSTWGWAKKPYKIKLDKKAEVLGLTANKDWILIANYADKSLIRNTVAYDMSRVMDFDWTPTQYPVDLFINGEYQGVYTIGEQMEVAKSRVNITEQSEDSEQCGYLLEVGGADSSVTAEGVDYFHTNSDMLNFVTFVYPSPDKITDEQRTEIIDAFNAADNAIVNGGDIAEYIDVDSFVDWVIIQELTNNTDSAFRRSCYMTKDVGGKIKMGPVWDFDLAFGNYMADNSAYNSWTIIGSDSEKAFIRPSWGNYLMSNASFRERLRERWQEVRDDLIAAAEKSIDEYSAKIYPSQEENFRVWQIWDKRVGYSSEWNAQQNTYELQVQYLRDFIHKRAEWIDNAITNQRKHIGGCR